MIIQLVFSIPGAVLAEISLSFISLSLSNAATLITDGFKIITLHSRYVLIPETLLILLTISIQLFDNATQRCINNTKVKFNGRNK